jgi:hypothetical protein
VIRKSELRYDVVLAVMREANVKLRQPELVLRARRGDVSARVPRPISSGLKSNVDFPQKDPSDRPT